MRLAAWLVFTAAALLEVSGDAAARRGLRSRSALWILLGCAALAVYGLVVNSVKGDFSKLLGVSATLGPGCRNAGTVADWGGHFDLLIVAEVIFSADAVRGLSPLLRGRRPPMCE